MLFVKIPNTSRGKVSLRLVMTRVAGVEIPTEKKVGISLRYIYGIGPASALKILRIATVDPERRVKDLSADELVKIREVLENGYTVEGALKHQVGLNIKRQKDIASYRGMRHVKNLPVRGQRTRTNARTKKGRRPVIGGMRKGLAS